MKRRVYLLMVLAVSAAALLSSACVATRKFTRNEMKALEGNLATRLEGDEKRIAGLENDSKEMAAHINAVEKKTDANTSEIGSVRTELSGSIAKVDAKATDALNA